MPGSTPSRTTPPFGRTNQRPHVQRSVGLRLAHARPPELGHPAASRNLAGFGSYGPLSATDCSLCKEVRAQIEWRVGDHFELPSRAHPRITDDPPRSSCVVQ
jgi:hypothetical protein